MGSELSFTPLATMFTQVGFLVALVFAGKSGAKTLYPTPPPYQPPVYPPAADGDLEVPETIYNPDLTANENGYGQRDPNCHIEEKVVFEDKCETYPEQMCYTQNVEKCRTESYKNCTGTIETKVDRVCFDVVELVCGLEEKIDYETLQEEFQVQKCTVVKDRVCDTTFDIDVNNRDDFQCCNVESDYCEEHEEVINDVTCKNTFEFDCKKEKRTDGGYGKEMVCTKTPKENCYETPRTIRKEVCRTDTSRYCQKFSNPFPQPVERQNCHFEPKKICEMEIRNRPKKAKRYSYFQDCKEVPRQICDQTEKKTVAPVCVMEDRLKCDYIPVKQCEEETKKYCYKVEKLVKEEVCDKKFSTHHL